MQLSEITLIIGFLFAALECADCLWGGGNGGLGGGYGGFQSGYNPHGHGYGPDVCAQARQRQQAFRGGGGRFPSNNNNNHNYQNQYPAEFGGFNNNAYFQDPTPIRNSQQTPSLQELLQPVLMSPYNTNKNKQNVGHRTNIANSTNPTSLPLTCSQLNKRDPEVFDQKCLSPLSSEHTPCSNQETFPIGTTAIITCKSPQYYSDSGEMLVEICKMGKWQSDGKTLTCKSNMMMDTKPSKPQNQPPSYSDPVAQYVQKPAYQVPIQRPGVYQDSQVPSNYDVTPSYWDQPQKTPDTPTIPESYNPMVYPPYFTTTTTTPTTTTPRPTTSTTTTATPETTQMPNHHFPHNLDWRNYQASQDHYSPPSPVSSTYNQAPTLHHSPPHHNYSSVSKPHYQQQTDYFHHSEPGKCPPLRSKSGAIMECLSKSPRKSNSGSNSGYILSISDCQDQQPHGTEATFKCQMYYEPLTGMLTQYRKCKDNGMWSGTDDGFGCKLECGKSNPGSRLPLITFGETTFLGQWPWHAALFIRDRGEIANACGGTLISNKAVLTAAHCVNLYLSSLLRDYDDIRVDLGRYHREKDDPYVQKLQVEKIVTHPAYNPFIFESDIAIIILKEPARIGFHVRPICFPKSQNAAFDEMQLADGAVATVVGWGLDETGESPNELRAAKLQVIGYKECIASFDEVDTGALLAKSTTFCAGNNNKTNVCRGDSGSGAYFAVKTSTGGTRWFLQGLVSLGINVSANDKSCDPEKVSIFTRISPYSDWIIRVLSENDAL